MVLLVLLIVAQINFVIGVLIGPLNDEEMAQGFLGLNCKSHIRV